MRINYIFIKKETYRSKCEIKIFIICKYLSNANKLNYLLILTKKFYNTDKKIQV